MIPRSKVQSGDLQGDVVNTMLKDVDCDGGVARLVEPLYGFTEVGVQILTGNSSASYKREYGELIRMVMSHVDDFNVSGPSKFVDDTTYLFKG